MADFLTPTAGGRGFGGASTRTAGAPLRSRSKICAAALDQNPGLRGRAAALAFRMLMTDSFFLWGFERGGTRRPSCCALAA
jgi:hypothetical protein